ncbi:MAG: hypothetical protein M1824_006424 [Vezdaea acicularis]|nr:MAG: hypothetical protein M1824_006424 [Vezdaea acicularis]
MSQYTTDTRPTEDTSGDTSTPSLELYRSRPRSMAKKSFSEDSYLPSPESSPMPPKRSHSFAPPVSSEINGKFPSARKVSLKRPFSLGLPSPPREVVVDSTELTINAFPGVKVSPFTIYKDAPLSPSKLRGRAFSKRPRVSSSLDRFIPKRRSPNSSIGTFQVSTPVDELTSSERITRNRDSGPDPFGPTPRNVSREREQAYISGMTRPRSPVLTRRPQVLSTGATATGVLGIRNNSADLNRQASVGAVWNVGGAINAGPPAGISNGQGGMLNSGTNAPMYNARFLEGKTSLEDLQKHEQRLAVAFEFDQTNKVLNFRSNQQAESSMNGRKWVPIKGAGLHKRTYEPTVWRDSEWMKEDSPTSKQLKASSKLKFILTMPIGDMTAVPKRRERNVPATPFR